MKITVIGSGDVGLVTAACLAEVGNDVFCLDLDERKVASLCEGRVPFHEPGLTDLVVRNQAAGRLRFSTDVAASVAHGEVQFIAVHTPPDEDGGADLQHVLAAAGNIGRHMDGFRVIVNKSTVPVGTAGKVREAVRRTLAERGLEDLEFAVLSNPEFLKEGAAVEDFMRPDRIVLGCEGDVLGRHARSVMRMLYAPFNRHHERTFYMDVRSAEFTKYAANSMLATRISFMNEMANLADAVGADIESVRLGIGSDPRIGYSFLYAGAGYGGSCFPKDIRALIRTGEEHGMPLRVLQSVEEVNRAQRRLLAKKIVARLGEDLSGCTIAVWGLAFKPNTDDLREAPSRDLIGDLMRRGASVRVHDPVALEVGRQVLAQDLSDVPDALERLQFCDNAMVALAGADALAIVTEWKAFQSPDFGEMKRQLHAPLIFDGRNLYEPDAMRHSGFEYHAIGRSGTATRS